VAVAQPGPDMVWIPGGTFLMGSDDHYPEEAPAHQVTVDGFWIDRHTVTNAEFARFVRATGHLTVAERAPDPADYPGARPELLVPAQAYVARMLTPLTEFPPRQEPASFTVAKVLEKLRSGVASN